MKKAISVLVAAILFCGTTVKAEQAEYDSKHDVALSYGIYSNSQYFSFIEDLVGITVTAGYAYFDNKKFVGPIAGEYFYRLNSFLGIGGIGVYATEGKDIMINKKENPKIGTSRFNYFTIIPAVKFDWLRREHFGLYSKAGFGATIVNERQKYNDGTDDESETAATVSWQFSFIGVEAGSAKVRGFAEFGFGEQGVLLAGVRYKF